MFEHPRGLAGLLGGMIMARFTRVRNEWMISLIDVQPGDHILEIGFGPGVLVGLLAERAADGVVEGVDVSALMLEQAGRRNRALIGSGRVRLREGSAVHLPFADNSFDKAVSSNSVQLWPDSLKGVMEMRRVLKPGGRIALVVQPVWAGSDRQVVEYGDWLIDLLKKSEFHEIELKTRPMRPVASLCVLGIKAE